MKDALTKDSSLISAGNNKKMMKVQLNTSNVCLVTYNVLELKLGSASAVSATNTCSLRSTNKNKEADFCNRKRNAHALE